LNVRSAGVRSGNAIIEGARIGVHDVIGLLQNGETVETVTANCFPQLTRSQVYECLAYYEDTAAKLICWSPPANDLRVKFLLDHDVPEDLSYLHKQLGHDVTLLRKALPTDTSDEAILRFAPEISAYC
jgi:uncharacterized protein (DUF433 family)